ncbi:PilZ domain-containing protein [Spirochaetota bacterium]
MRRIYNDKRDYIRMEVDTEISFKIQGDTKIHRGKCIDISHDGVKFETDINMPAGTSLQAVISMSNGKMNPLESNIVILRVEKSLSDKYITAGKMFNVR